MKLVEVEATEREEEKRVFVTIALEQTVQSD
jgi:hypothetical protein